MDPPRPAHQPSHRDDALAVVQCLRAAGHVAYFAGGCVRDLLLKASPKDYDVATDALPKQVQGLFKNTQAVGQAFGVILVRQGSSIIEVATFRSDGQYRDGRHPESIRFVTAREDAQRRDFTINGLFFDPVAHQVIDYVDGQADLAHRIIRAIGDPNQRFDEDHLRLLRAVRFAARLDFSIESATSAAMTRHAPQLARISPERIAEELRHILTPISRNIAWKLLRAYGLADVIFRLLPCGDTHPSARDEQNFNLFAAVDSTRPISFALALAAVTLEQQWRCAASGIDLRELLSHPRIAHARQALRKSLKISNEESDGLTGILKWANLLLADAPPSLAQRKRFMASAVSGDTRLLLDALAHCGMMVERIALLRADFAKLDTVDCAPIPLITGDDLRAAGLTPGPRFKTILHAVYDAQLEFRITTQSEAMNLAMELSRR